MAATTPERVGPYRIRERLGEGGMGIVYRAEQSEPIRREVALKLLKPGMDSERILARFESERRSLAVMEHPSIATVHEAGTTESGRPYFVMELVRGVPLLEYGDAKRLDIRERVALFLQVCRAIQHAHQKGVIHRDLKPSNILVSEADGKPLAKVIDFGIARATEDDPDGTRLTRADELVGTPAYMSPEQMGAEPDIDTRSDIYALGVLLYELLSGTLPFEPEAYRGWAAYAAVRERETPTPSARFRAWPGASGAAELRGAGPEAVIRSLRGDLDWIVMKAMERERDRRYETANGLALDLERFLADEPVLARPPSAGYRVRKFVRRHTAGVASAGALALALVGVAILQTVQAERIARARDEAALRQGQAEDLIGFMLGDLRGKLEPLGRLELLDDVGDQALAYFAAVPEERLSDQELFRRTQTLRQLGEVRVAQGDLPAALQAFRESLELSKELVAREPENGEWQVGLGASHFWVGYVHYLRNELEPALAEFVPYLEISERLVEAEPENETYRLELGYAHSTIGSVKEAQGDLEGALEAFRRTLEVKRELAARAPTDADRRFDLAVEHNKVGVVLQKLGRLPEAEEAFRSELRIKEELVEEDPSNAAWRRHLADAHAFLANLLELRGAEEEAVAHRRSDHGIVRELAEQDPENAEWRRNLAASERTLGASLVASGEVGEGLRLLRGSRSRLAALLADDPTNGDWRHLAARAALSAARAFHGEGLLDSARVAASQARRAFESLADESPEAPGLRRDVAESGLLLGRILAAAGGRAEARASWEGAAALMEPLVRESGSAEYLLTWARALLLLDRTDEARPIVADLRARGYGERELLELARARELTVR